MNVLQFLAGLALLIIAVNILFYLGYRIHDRFEEKWWIIPKIVGFLIIIVGAYLIDKSDITLLFDIIEAIWNYLYGVLSQ